MIAPRRRKRYTFLPWAQLLFDCLSINLVLYACFWARFVSGYFQTTLSRLDYPVYLKSFNFITIILILFMRFYGLYRPARFLTFVSEVMKILKAVLLTIIVLMAITFFIRGFSFSRTFLVMVGLILFTGIALERFLLSLLVMQIDKKRGSLKNVLIIGCGEEAHKLVRYYQHNPRFSAQVVGFLGNNLESGKRFEGVEVLGEISELPHFLRHHRHIHEVILAQENPDNEMVLKVIYECEKEMVTFRWIAGIFGLLASKMHLSYIGTISLLSFTDSPLIDWENRFLKRFMDVSGALTLLVVLSPLLLLIAMLVKLGSKGPVFYRQQRIGEDGRHFLLIKFRTMFPYAEAKSGPVWAKENDERRTRIGMVLRQNNLDELPQLWNVLVGDMSLVGPRPERPHFVSQFKEDIPRYMARHSIRSGMTGWAQVNGLRGNTSIEERTKYDLYYIENWSLLFDLKILLMTLFTKRNAY